jgi:hypothetical protein
MGARYGRVSSPLETSLTQSGGPGVFGGQTKRCDCIHQQSVRRIDASSESHTIGVIHSPEGEYLGFSGPTELDFGQMRAAVINLLNLQRASSQAFVALP